MSIFEQAINVIKNDLTKVASAWSDRIMKANLPHAEYAVAQTTYRVLADVVNHIGAAVSFIQKNPDAALPESFVAETAGMADPEKESDDVPTSTTVDISSGAITQGVASSDING